MRTSTLLTALATASVAYAKTIVITVGTNLTSDGTDFDASDVFVPNVIEARKGDVIIFNFTDGTHSATRSTFDQPCVPISSHNNSVNGFNTGLRPTNNGTTRTDYQFTIDDSTFPETVWYYDEATCGNGGVGAININTTGWQPFDAYVRNAERLFGPHANDTPTSTGSDSQTGGSGGDSPAPTGVDDGTDAAGRSAAVGFGALALAAFALLV
ncbi:hypothetical protein AURDEDRAFT_110127 [Auricularia subglabra TFB-10046 SS5]|nr:hypothetical protein AURDEDRAFT_110127 [Auricularia subglabra TFB-10046 SS5]